MQILMASLSVSTRLADTDLVSVPFRKYGLFSKEPTRLGSSENPETVR